MLDSINREEFAENRAKGKEECYDGFSCKNGFGIRGQGKRRRKK